MQSDKIGISLNSLSGTVKHVSCSCSSHICTFSSSSSSFSTPHWVCRLLLTYVSSITNRIALHSISCRFESPSINQQLFEEKKNMKKKSIDFFPSIRFIRRIEMSCNLALKCFVHTMIHIGSRMNYSIRSRDITNWAFCSSVRVSVSDINLRTTTTTKNPYTLRAVWV